MCPISDMPLEAINSSAPPILEPQLLRLEEKRFKREYFILFLCQASFNLSKSKIQFRLSKRASVWFLLPKGTAMVKNSHKGKKVALKSS